MYPKFPKIQNIEKSKDKVCLTFFVSKNLFYFQGHFEQFPVLPGVAQTHWALCYGIEYFGELKEFRGFDSVKFMSPITPGRSMNLEIEYFEDKEKLKFRYFNEKSKFAQGVAQIKLVR